MVILVAMNTFFLAPSTTMPVIAATFATTTLSPTLKSRVANRRIGVFSSAPAGMSWASVTLKGVPSLTTTRTVDTTGVGAGGGGVGAGVGAGAGAGGGVGVTTATG